MYVIVAGGGKVGFYLARELVEQNHEVLIIERNPRRAAEIEADLGSIVMAGDACEATVLREAGAERADLVAAVTGDDEDNLVICQVCKARYHSRRAIARINNPKNAEIFHRLGIDDTVSATEVVLSVIEQEIPREHLIPLLRLRETDVEIVEAKIERGSRVAGQRIRDVRLPSPARIAVIIREGTAIFPEDDTPILIGDEVIAFTTSKNEAAFREALLGG
ncbi:MAG: trk/ktr system potassium uptake protein [Chloroflexota bacterium]|jgi:trk system potassium uptake protein TrkA|nr:trk/ktr system potassium uptake protein [Chloroflexota bacterium]